MGKTIGQWHEEIQTLESKKLIELSKCIDKLLKWKPFEEEFNNGFSIIKTMIDGAIELRKGKQENEG